ncbi:MAG: hypothetical protein DRJ42_25010, partial [Deltaproteobacteria bacterium]
MGGTKVGLKAGFFWAGLAILGAAAVVPAIFPAQARAQAADPHLTWRTVRTSHFEIHYHEPLGLVARRVAAIAERAHERLAPLLDHEPSEVTRIVLSDNSDFANGSATVIPFNRIRLFATGPEDISALSDFDDWLTLLVTHEHTHILHLDTIGGIPALINMVFGKIYPPNSVQPGWFLEGLATYEESLHTSAGRIRSTVFDMYLRTDALEGRLLRMDQISNAVDRFPRGNVRYLYGSRFIEFIAERYGHEALTAMSHDYGSQLIPYGVNRTAERATGKTLVELYQEWLTATRGRYRRTARRIRSQGLRTGQNLTNHGMEARAPRFLDDRQLVYYASDGRDRPQLRVIDARDGEVLGELDRASGAAYSSPHPDGHHVYYSSLETHRDLYNFYDLFRIDRRGGSRERLTRGMRAREPDVSPNGRRLTFVINGASTTHLAVADIGDIEGTKEIIFRSPRFHQVYTPKWSGDGQTIAFSAWREGGYRDILLIDVATGRVEEVTRDRALDIGPAWGPGGRYLYFASDRTGISNIYAYELSSGRTLQVTNVLGGAFSPTISPDGTRIAYLGFARDGWDIWAMDLDPSAFRPAAPYLDDRPAAEP